MPMIDKAITFAAKAHKGQVRKGANQPYIFHPLEVLNVVSTMTLDDDILCAAVLHDTVEDTDTSIGDIKREFGNRVAQLVYYDSEDKRTDYPPEDTWRLRKMDTIKILNELDDIGGKMVCLGDKVSNLRSFHMLQMTEGEKMWEHFHMHDPLMHYWYYDEIRKALKDLEQYGAYKEYCFLVDTVFSKYLKGDNDEQ